ncbi:MAG: glycosyltransferase family 2 protein [Actinomycetota bacterium]|nr:glycosyltransferase family 2 protein [Actinomycetota bacterium]
MADGGDRSSDAQDKAAPAQDGELATVVIPALDEELFIARCLDSVLAQDHEHLEILVVDGGSSDRTLDIIRSYSRADSRIELLHNAAGAIPKSLNLALSQARGGWLVRIDAHSTVPSHYVRKALSHLRTNQWGGVGGRKDGVGVTPSGQAIAAAMGSFFGVGNSTYHHGTELQVVEHVPFGAYPTELLRELGGWNEELHANEDFELDYRIRLHGLQLLFDPEMRINWHCRQSVSELFKQYRRYGRGKARVGRLHPKSLRLRQVLPSVQVACWLLALLLIRRRPALLAGSVAPYLIAVSLASIITAREVHGMRAKATMPAAFAAMHFGWGVGLLEEMIKMGLRPNRERPALVGD